MRKTDQILHARLRQWFPFRADLKQSTEQTFIWFVGKTTYLTYPFQTPEFPLPARNSQRHPGVLLIEGLMAITVVGVFEHFSQAENAIDDLQRAGIERNQISLIANGENVPGHGNSDLPINSANTSTANIGEADQTTAAEDEHRSRGAAAESGAVVGGIAGLVIGLAALAIPGFGPVLAAGPIAAALASLGIGAAAGGVLGALTGMNIPEKDAHAYADSVRQGRAVVLVHANEGNAADAREVLDRANAQMTEFENESSSGTVSPTPATTTPTASRIYIDGLEITPPRTRLENLPPR